MRTTDNAPNPASTTVATRSLCALDAAVRAGVPETTHIRRAVDDLMVAELARAGSYDWLHDVIALPAVGNAALQCSLGALAEKGHVDVAGRCLASAAHGVVSRWITPATSSVTVRSTAYESGAREVVIRCSSGYADDDFIKGDDLAPAVVGLFQALCVKC